ncbi:hypothetical protein WA026_013350 [Henosepilachna vigintioctopunctata]|uniref:Uncharacterized protein n=1 Tax=Henosepilachna vigintioctopunctata TaxID=420089 RepID=A0AAW1VG01_9CUCU
MDIKAQLKKAREAINKKDYKKAVDICKDVLNEDKNNYIALVFLGLSIQETIPNNARTRETEKAFRKAIEIDSDNLLAWNGLANYFEKFDTAEAKLELIKIYAFIIGKETNEKKVIDYCEKLCALYKYTNVEDICRVIYNKVETGNLSETALACSRSSLASILKETNELSQDILVVYEDVLSHLISNTMTVTPDYYSQYLLVLYRLRKLDLLVNHTLQMYKMYPEDITSMNWICKMYNELCIENKVSFISSFTNIEEVYEKLLLLEPQNTMGLFTKALCDVKNENFLDAKKYLRNIVAVRSGLIHAWVLLTRVNLSLHCYNDASESAMFVCKLMQSPKCTFDDTLKLEVHKLYLEALSRSPEIADWENAIDHYLTLDEKYKPDCLPYYIRANINSDNITEAEKWIKCLEDSTQSNSDLIGNFMAQLLRKQQKHKEAFGCFTKRKNPKFRMVS